MKGVITRSVLTALVLQVLIGQRETQVSGYSYNNWNQQPVQQYYQYPVKNHYHQQHHQQQHQPQKQNYGWKSGDNTNEVHKGRWALEAGCWWTGCQSRLHRHACPAATYKHDSVDCATLLGHVDVKCCRQPPRTEVTQITAVYTQPPTTVKSTTTTTTTERTTTTTTTPKTTTTTTTTTTTPTTTTTTTPETTTTTTTTEAPTTPIVTSPETPPPAYDYDSREVTPA